MSYRRVRHKTDHTGRHRGIKLSPLDWKPPCSYTLSVTHMQHCSALSYRPALKQDSVIRVQLSGAEHLD